MAMQKVGLSVALLLAVTCNAQCLYSHFRDTDSVNVRFAVSFDCTKWADLRQIFTSPSGEARDPSITWDDQTRRFYILASPGPPFLPPQPQLISTADFATFEYDTLTLDLIPGPISAAWAPEWVPPTFLPASDNEQRWFAIAIGRGNPFDVTLPFEPWLVCVSLSDKRVTSAYKLMLNGSSQGRIFDLFPLGPIDDRYWLLYTDQLPSRWKGDVRQRQSLASSYSPYGPYQQLNEDSSDWFGLGDRAEGVSAAILPNGTVRVWWDTWKQSDTPTLSWDRRYTVVWTDLGPDMKPLHPVQPIEIQAEHGTVLPLSSDAAWVVLNAMSKPCPIRLVRLPPQ